jgi:hypothetical protein
MNSKKSLCFLIVLVLTCATTVFANVEPTEGYYHSRDRWSILLAKGSASSNTHGVGEWIIQIRNDQGNIVFNGVGRFSPSGGTSKSFSYNDGNRVQYLTFTSNTYCNDSKTGKGYTYSYGL